MRKIKILENRKLIFSIFSGIILILAIIFSINYFIQKSDSSKFYRYKDWKVSFDRALMDEELKDQGITVVDSKNNAETITLSWSDGATAVIVNPPKGGYKSGETYTLKVDSKIGFTIEGCSKNQNNKIFKVRKEASEGKIIKFKDNNLEMAVRKAIGKSIGDITFKDVDSVTELVATFNHISDLSGIENLVNLHRLYLDGNDISDISPLKNLTDLKELGLSKNKIANISAIKGLTMIETLWLIGNPIKDYSPAEKNLKSLIHKDFN